MKKNITPPTILLKALLFLLIAGFAANISAAQVARTGDTTSMKVALKAMLQEEGAKGLKKLTVAISGEQARGLRSTYGIDAEGNYTVYNGMNAEGGIMGTVIIVNQAGKEGPLQALVAIRPDGTVYDIGFTIFGEDKGKPALRWSFLKQFMGLDVSRDIKIGKDVDGISGATKTSTSIAIAVKRALTVYKEFISENAD